MSEINNIANQITNISPEFGNKPNIATDSDGGNFSNAIGKFLKAVNQDQMQAKEAVSDTKCSAETRNKSSLCNPLIIFSVSGA